MNLIINLIKNHKEIGIITIFYFFLRLINLTKIPVFNDEAIYLDWGWRSVHVPGNLFYSLYDGKQPLLMWIFGIFESIFSDPLFAGRIVSVIAGFIAALGIYLIGKKYFNRKVAINAILLYSVIPIFAFFDRQALMESAISAIAVWLIYLFLNLLDNPTTLNAYFLGATLGFGYFIKSNSLFFSLSIFVLCIVHFYKSKSINKKQIFRMLLKAFIISQAILAVLYIQGRFWSTLSMNSRYSLSMLEIIKLPVTKWINNFKNYFEISFWQLTPLILIAGFFGLLMITRENNKRRNYIAYYFIINLILLVIFTRNITSRYIVSFLPLITLFCSYFAFIYREKINFYISSFILILVPFLITIFQIASPMNYFNFLSKFTSFSQKDEYINSWTSGYGVREAYNFTEDIAGNKNIILGVRLDAGNPENGILMYAYKNKNITPVYFDSKLLDKKALESACIKTKMPLYFVSRGGQLAGLNKYLYEIKKFYKPEGSEYVGVYGLKDKCGEKVYNLSIN
ncbi:MAG: glycosyltransferase family 39 protein [Cyanobacteria bacterium]|nr:glycosyltransferase family 39 protein [Cyanobacteriota bacterium]